MKLLGSTREAWVYALVFELLQQDITVSLFRDSIRKLCNTVLDTKIRQLAVKWRVGNAYRCAKVHKHCAGTNKKHCCRRRAGKVAMCGNPWRCFAAAAESVCFGVVAGISVNQ